MHKGKELLHEMAFHLIAVTAKEGPHHVSAAILNHRAAVVLAEDTLRRSNHAVGSLLKSKLASPRNNPIYYPMR